MTIDFSKCPERYRLTLQNYLEHRTPPGSGMEAILSSDLADAISRCDDQTVADLKPIVVFLYNHVPGDCWGSRKAVNDWLRNQAD